MDWYRLRHTLGLHLCLTADKRADYIRKHNLFYHMGNDCMTMFRKVPLYPKLISIGNNVWLASGITFVPHDVIHMMINNLNKENTLSENLGCIDIRDNVFIGANTTILPDVSIGPNAIIAAGTLVNKSIENGVYGGVPVKYICSIEDFVNKRKREKKPVVEHGGKGGLSDKTIADYWEYFRNNNTTRKVE